jgi:pimeloyl-ACP methyl ester carboxylesterase
MPYELPPDPRSERRSRITGRIAFVASVLLIVLVAYFAYVGFEGSRQLTDAPDPSRACRTPAAFGWTYEAVNYDVAGDAALANEPDPLACQGVGAPAGDAVTGPGEVGLAGWYVPAASGIPATGPTVVIAHGWGSNKSDMLDRAAVLHGSYNLLLLDLRNHGQSGEAATTQGVREAADVRAMLDWLETTKAPDRVAVLGVSMGGATALNAAARDERIDAVIAESTHAAIADAIQARLERSGYPLAMPGSWAVLLGTLMRTGVDVSSADPVQTVEHLDGRPVLLIHGALDDTIDEADVTRVRDAGIAAGSPVDLETCEAAAHAGAPEACPEAYAAAVLGFLERALAAGG